MQLYRTHPCSLILCHPSAQLKECAAQQKDCTAQLKDCTARIHLFLNLLALRFPRYLGAPGVALVVVLLFSGQAALQAADWWLADWSTAGEEQGDIRWVGGEAEACGGRRP